MEYIEYLDEYEDVVINQIDETNELYATIDYNNLIDDLTVSPPNTTTGILSQNKTFEEFLNTEEQYYNKPKCKKTVRFALDGENEKPDKLQKDKIHDGFTPITRSEMKETVDFTPKKISEVKKKVDFTPNRFEIEEKIDFPSTRRSEIIEETDYSSTRRSGIMEEIDYSPTRKSEIKNKINYTPFRKPEMKLDTKKHAQNKNVNEWMLKVDSKVMKSTEIIKEKVQSSKRRSEVIKERIKSLLKRNPEMENKIKSPLIKKSEIIKEKIEYTSMDKPEVIKEKIEPKTTNKIDIRKDKKDSVPMKKSDPKMVQKEPETSEIQKHKQVSTQIKKPEQSFLKLSRTKNPIAKKFKLHKTIKIKLHRSEVTRYLQEQNKMKEIQTEENPLSTRFSILRRSKSNLNSKKVTITKSVNEKNYGEFITNLKPTTTYQSTPQNVDKNKKLFLINSFDENRQDNDSSEIQSKSTNETFKEAQTNKKTKTAKIIKPVTTLKNATKMKPTIIQKPCDTDDDISSSGSLQSNSSFEDSDDSFGGSNYTFDESDDSTKFNKDPIKKDVTLKKNDIKSTKKDVNVKKIDVKSTQNDKSTEKDVVLKSNATTTKNDVTTKKNESNISKENVIIHSGILKINPRKIESKTDTNLFMGNQSQEIQIDEAIDPNQGFYLSANSEENVDNYLTFETSQDEYSELLTKSIENKNIDENLGLKTKRVSKIKSAEAEIINTSRTIDKQNVKMPQRRKSMFAETSFTKTPTSVNDSVKIDITKSNLTRSKLIENKKQIFQPEENSKTVCETLPNKRFTKNIGAQKIESKTIRTTSEIDSVKSNLKSSKIIIDPQKSEVKNLKTIQNVTPSKVQFPSKTGDLKENKKITPRIDSPKTTKSNQQPLKIGVSEKSESIKKAEKHKIIDDKILTNEIPEKKTSFQIPSYLFIETKLVTANEYAKNKLESTLSNRKENVTPLLSNVLNISNESGSTSTKVMKSSSIQTIETEKKTLTSPSNIQKPTTSVQKPRTNIQKTLDTVKESNIQKPTTSGQKPRTNIQKTLDTVKEAAENIKKNLIVTQKKSPIIQPNISNVKETISKISNKTNNVVNLTNNSQTNVQNQLKPNDIQTMVKEATTTTKDKESFIIRIPAQPQPNDKTSVEVILNKCTNLIEDKITRDVQKKLQEISEGFTWGSKKSVDKKAEEMKNKIKDIDCDVQTALKFFNFLSKFLSDDKTTEVTDLTTNGRPSNEGRSILPDNVDRTIISVNQSINLQPLLLNQIQNETIVPIRSTNLLNQGISTISTCNTQTEHNTIPINVFPSKRQIVSEFHNYSSNSKNPRISSVESCGQSGSMVNIPIDSQNNTSAPVIFSTSSLNYTSAARNFTANLTPSLVNFTPTILNVSSTANFPSTLSSSILSTPVVSSFLDLASTSSSSLEMSNFNIDSSTAIEIKSENEDEIEKDNVNTSNNTAPKTIPGSTKQMVPTRNSRIILNQSKIKDPTLVNTVDPEDLLVPTRIRTESKEQNLFSSSNHNSSRTQVVRPLIKSSTPVNNKKEISNPTHEITIKKRGRKKKSIIKTGSSLKRVKPNILKKIPNKTRNKIKIVKELRNTGNVDKRPTRRTASTIAAATTSKDTANSPYTEDYSLDTGFEFKCQKCPVVQPSMELIRDHIEKSHASPSQSCSICGIVLRNFELMQKHFAEKHDIK